MALSNINYKKDNGTMGNKPDIIRAAEIGDLGEGIAALKENPDCIYNTDSQVKMNAIQMALIQGQEEFARFLLSNTEISVLYKDALGRDALDIALSSLCCSEELVEFVNDKWYEQLRLQDEKKASASVTQLNTTRPKPKF